MFGRLTLENAECNDNSVNAGTGYYRQIRIRGCRVHALLISQGMIDLRTTDTRSLTINDEEIKVHGMMNHGFWGKLTGFKLSQDKGQ